MEPAVDVDWWVWWLFWCFGLINDEQIRKVELVYVLPTTEVKSPSCTRKINDNKNQPQSKQTNKTSVKSSTYWKLLKIRFFHGILQQERLGNNQGRRRICCRFGCCRHRGRHCRRDNFAIARSRHGATMWYITYWCISVWLLVLCYAVWRSCRGSSMFDFSLLFLKIRQVDSESVEWKSHPGYVKNRKESRPLASGHASNSPICSQQPCKSSWLLFSTTGNYWRSLPSLAHRSYTCCCLVVVVCTSKSTQQRKGLTDKRLHRSVRKDASNNIQTDSVSLLSTHCIKHFHLWNSYYWQKQPFNHG